MVALINHLLTYLVELIVFVHRQKDRIHEHNFNTDKLMVDVVS